MYRMKSRLMTGACVLVAVLGAGAASAQSVAPITYSGSITGTTIRDRATLTTNYTITTDGTLGILSSSNIRGYTASFFLNGSTVAAESFASTDPNAGFVFTNGSTSATLTSLFFDFGSTADQRLYFYIGDETAFGFNSQTRQGSNFGPLRPAYSFAQLAQTGDREQTDVASVIQPIASVVLPVTPVAPVPEPASWAMMIVGFGLVGGTVRRRSAITTHVTYAA